MLDILLKEIEKKINEEKSRIIEKYEKEIQNVNETADKLMKQIQEKEEKKFKQQQLKYDKHLKYEFESAKRKYLQQAHLKYSHEIFEDIKQQFSKIENDSIYPEILQKYYQISEETYRKHSTSPPIVVVNPNDIKHLKEFIPEDIILQGDENISRGVEFHSPDNKIVVHNSVDSRFEKGKDKFLQIINKMLQNKW